MADAYLAKMTPPSAERSHWLRRLFAPQSGEWSDQQALLNGLLLTLTGLSVTALVLMAFFEPFGASPLSLAVAAGAGVFFGAAYALSRAGRYRPAALLTVGTTAVALWVSMLTRTPSLENDAIVLPYLVVPLLLAGLLLPLGATLVVAAGNWLTVMFHPAFRAGASPTFSFNALVFLLVITVLVGAMARLRERRAQEIARRSRELADSVAQFQNAFDLAAIGMALVSPDGYCLRANPSLCALLGYAEAELQALTVQRLTHPDDIEVDLQQMRRLLAGEIQTYQLDKRYYRKDGRLVWATLSVSLVLTAGVPLHFIAQIQDISERKAVEEALRASEARFRLLNNASPVGIYQTDARGADVFHNERWQAMTGMSTEEAVGDGWLQSIHSEDRPAVEAEWARCVRERQPFSMEYRFLDRLGREYWAQSRAIAVVDRAGELTGFVGTVADITERKQTEQALQTANERMAGWVTELEAHSRDIGLLNELTNLLQSCFSAQEAYGILRQMAAQLFPGQGGLLGVTNASRNLVETAVAWGEPALEGGPAVFVPDDCWALRRGRLHWYEAGAGAVRCPHLGSDEPPSSLCLPMMAHGETLGVLHLRAAPGAPPLSEARRGFAQTVADSVSLALANLKLRERLRDQSIRDVLTGLFNRRYLEETLSRELSRAERDHQPLGVLMFDIDHFKRFNDTYGHAAGDEVLRALGRLLAKHVRLEDIACRYGGEEFTVMLPGCGLAAASERAEQIRRAVSGLQVHHAGQVLSGLTVSIGVAVLPEHGRTDTELLRAADAALYQAKQAGRDRVRAVGAPADVHSAARGRGA